MTQYIYVASSWRNYWHEGVVNRLRASGFSCYDFKRDEGAAFSWTDVDPEYERGKTMTLENFKLLINHDRSRDGFASDFGAMNRADTFVLVHPAGRSAHLELGWAVGKHLDTAILFPNGVVDEPDLMYKMVGFVTQDIGDLIEWLSSK